MSFRSTRRKGRPDPIRREVRAGVIGLVILVLAAYISYTSSDGLPWSNDYEITADVRNAERLTAGNEVVIAGQRVGRVADVESVAPSGGRPAHARASLSIDSDVELPADTSVLVRPDSVLGASYIELRPGRSRDHLAEGDGIRVGRNTARPQLTDLFDVFDRSTARNIQQSVSDLSAGLAGRGTALNSSLGSLAEAMPPLERVSRSLAARETRLSDFIAAYARLAREVDPAAGDLAGLTRGGARTFAALAAEAPALRTSLERLAPAEVATTRALTSVTPALDSLAAVMTELRPAGPLLRPALRQANGALAAGRPALARFPRLSRDLRSTLATLRTVTRTPATNGALRKLTEGMGTGGGLFDTLRAGQVNCNAFTLWSTNLGDLWGGTGAGSGPSHALIGLGLARMGGVGEVLQSPGPAPDIGMNYVPNNDDDECESGNEVKTPGTQEIGNPAGLQSSDTWDTRLSAATIAEARAAGLLDPPPWEAGK
jgi:phospholipid/cholesterol/gamma-HCH transport system substrate-binding protein